MIKFNINFYLAWQATKHYLQSTILIKFSTLAKLSRSGKIVPKKASAKDAKVYREFTKKYAKK